MKWRYDYKSEIRHEGHLMIKEVIMAMFGLSEEDFTDKYNKDPHFQKGFTILANLFVESRYEMIREPEMFGLDKNCKTCSWSRDIENFADILKCGCHLSGAFNTDVLTKDSCDQWKKSSDDYLRFIGENKKIRERDGCSWNQS